MLQAESRGKVQGRDIQLFLKFADQRRCRSFARFQLAAGKLPLSAIRAGQRALRGQKTRPLADNGRSHFNVLPRGHQPSSGSARAALRASKT